MKRIVITAGHSTKDPGAVNGPITEADVCADLRNLVSFYLTRGGIPHAKDGSGGENLPLNAAIKLITPGSIAVEFHCNAFSATSTGVETLSNQDKFELGKKLCAAIAGVLGIPNRGAKAQNSGQHTRLGFVAAGGLILETFFISNNNDLRVYMDKKWLVAKAIADVLIEEADA